MEMIQIPKEEYLRMKAQIAKLQELQEIDFELVEKFKKGLEDLKSGRVRRVA